MQPVQIMPGGSYCIERVKTWECGHMMYSASRACIDMYIQSKMLVMFIVEMVRLYFIVEIL